VDAAVRTDGPGPMTFVDELRRAFRAGGFPYWARPGAADGCLPWEYRPAVEKVLPVLRECLLEL
jgi:hypothetical protein